MPAPVVLFAFNRPEHLARTLQALAANELAAESDLVIICDGPRNDAERELTDAVRRVARAAAGFHSYIVVEREKNYGLATNIIAGVTAMFERHERLVVLEDDLLTSPYFLRYMNDGLAMYADNPKVASIHGWCFPHTVPNPPETFFLKGTDCLGWGAWKRAWSVFEPDARRLLVELRSRKLEYAFNCNGVYDYMEMLRAVRDGTASSWAVRWRATAFINDMYTLHPSRSLVQHAGGDGLGTNVGVTDIFDVSLTPTPVAVALQAIEENALMRRADMAFHERFGHAKFSRRVRALLAKKSPRIYSFLKRVRQQWVRY